MFKEIGSYDAKTKLPALLRRVQAGEGFTITKRGKPIAELIPSRAEKNLRTQSAINNILNQKKPSISDKTLADFKENGRK